MAIQERLDHAKHNEEVCVILFNAKKYDWTVTTAFYSALHFIQHKIFPLSSKTADGHKFKIANFNIYAKGNHHFARLSKHEMLIELVETHCPEIAGEYNWLYNTCRNSRYHQYNISEKVAMKAVETLKKIREYCDSTADGVKEAKDPTL